LSHPLRRLSFFSMKPSLLLLWLVKCPVKVYIERLAPQGGTWWEVLKSGGTSLQNGLWGLSFSLPSLFLSVSLDVSDTTPTCTLPWDNNLATAPN
jgi:hypothetical protein